LEEGSQEQRVNHEECGESFAQPHKTTNFVMPAQAGIQKAIDNTGFRFSPE
jgi:hypothetical protein